MPAVILGETNVPVGLRDIQSFDNIHGIPSAIRGTTPRTPGGSSGGPSGGSAAALASGFDALSIGSDLGVADLPGSGS